MGFDVFGLFPPAAKDTPDGIWQRSVIVAMIVFAGIVFSSGAALGTAVWTAQNEQSTLKEAIASLREDSLVTKILMLRTRYCDAVAQGRQFGIDTWSEQVTIALAEFRKVTGRDFPQFNPCAMPAVVR